MEYNVINTAYTPNNRELETLTNENGNIEFALHIAKYTLIYDNKILPQYNKPEAEIIFSDDLTALLMIDAGRADELDDYDLDYGLTLYTANEYTRKLNGYTPNALNR